MEIVWTVVFCLGLLTGIMASLFQLPGTVVVFLTALIAGLCSRFELTPWWLLVTLGVVSVGAETVDNLLSAWAVKRFEGTNRGMAGAIALGLVGALVGGAVTGILGALGIALGPVAAVVIFVTGPIVGGCTGGWLGAYLAERTHPRPPAEAVRAAWGAFWGRAVGVILKLIACTIMSALAAWIVIGRLLEANGP